MSISDNTSAAKSASIALVAASQAKLYADQASEFEVDMSKIEASVQEAKDSATAAQGSATISSQSAAQSASSATQASSSASDAATSAASAAAAATTAVNDAVVPLQKGTRNLWKRTLAEAGLKLVAGSFEKGTTLTLPTDALLYEAEGQSYVWKGTLPKTVSSGSTPETSGGISDTAWSPASDILLRQAIADAGSGKGSNLIGTKLPLTGAVQRVLQDKITDNTSIKDFGATMDGTLHPLSERFTTLTAAQMVYPFVTSLSQSLDSAALQANMDTGKTVQINDGVGFVNATHFVNRSVRIVGVGTSQINRSQSFLSVDGNISLFALKQGDAQNARMYQFFCENLYIFYNPGVTPTNPTTDGGKIAFNFYSTVPNSTGLEMSEIRNCTVHGAWRCFGDSTGTYLTTLRNVWARYCHDGIIKANGTTITLEMCYAEGCISPYQIGAVFSFNMLNCGMDRSAISVSNGSQGYAGLHLTSVHGFNILGLFTEGNVVSTNGGASAALIHFENSTGRISGLTSNENSLKTESPTASGVVDYIAASGTSHVIIDSCEDDSTGSGLQYTGSGYPATLHARDATSRIDVMSGKYRAPVGGNPAISVVSQGNVNWYCEPVSGLISGGYSQSTSAAGLKTPAFYTQKGTQAVAANTATSLFTLPDVPGMYLISVLAANSGTNFSSLQSAFWDGGTLTLTPLKAGGLISFGAAGRTVNITSQGATTFNWTYTKVG